MPGSWDLHPGTPVTPGIIFFGLFFGGNFSMMGLGGGSTDDTWIRINFPHQWIYNTVSVCLDLDFGSYTSLHECQDGQTLGVEQ